MLRIPWIALALLTLQAAAAGQAVREPDTDKAAREEEEDYFRKWLNEDVVYIITPEERKIFESLTTPEEKEQFIEQFWLRRDPDPTTAVNEFKEEHYRRIAYANEHFASGIKGWQTDRGKVYIIHGPPDEVETHPSGGPYHRPMSEGGGSTVTFPFEIWRYRHIPGIGSDVVLEFVDRTQSGEYRLALTPEEKDVLLHVEGYGLTISEEMGFTRKEDRLYFSPWNRFTYRGPFNYYQDPFERYERFVQVQKPRAVKYKDLQEIVKVNITYENLPFRFRQDLLRLNEAQILTPITIELDNRELTFQDEGGVQIARVAVYGVVSDISNRLILEFDDDLVTSFKPEEMDRGRLGRSIYQKAILLESRGRYKLNLVVKDLNSGKIGTLTRAILPPSWNGDGLKASSLILSDRMYQLEEVPQQEEMFVLGDFYVRPCLQCRFPSGRPVNAYLQLYDVAFDQTTGEPSLSFHYRIVRDGETVLDFDDAEGRSVQYFSNQRVVVAAGFPLERVEPGRYELRVEVKDNLSGKTLQLSQSFDVIPELAQSAEGSPQG
ncbi:MAG: hypothetical protein Kow00109_14440 [Acidobacteriota bacterium]